MEREAGIPYPSRGTCRVQEFQGRKIPEFLPLDGIRQVEEVMLNATGPDSFQFFSENPVHISVCPDVPGGELGSKEHLFPIPVGNGFAHHPFTLTMMVGRSGIDVVHSAIDGIRDLAYCSLLIDPPHPCRKPHRTIAQGGQAITILWYSPVLHGLHPRCTWIDSRSGRYRYLRNSGVISKKTVLSGEGRSGSAIPVPAALLSFPGVVCRQRFSLDIDTIGLREGAPEICLDPEYRFMHLISCGAYSKTYPHIHQQNMKPHIHRQDIARTFDCRVRFDALPDVRKLLGIHPLPHQQAHGP